MRAERQMKRRGLKAQLKMHKIALKVAQQLIPQEHDPGNLIVAPTAEEAAIITCGRRLGSRP